MRLSTICICSTAHLPPEERAAFDSLIASAPRRDGRVIVEHTVLSIEPHQFAVHLGLFDDHRSRPEEISQALWQLLSRARNRGASWLWFDRDEPAAADLPAWNEDDNAAAPVRSPDSAENPPPISIRCEKCGGADVIRDASARWNDTAQEWSLSGLT